MTQDRCPGGGVLQDYLLGRLPEDQAARIDRHLDVCENCLATLANCQSETDPLIVRLRATGLPESFCLERPCQEAVARVKALSGGQKPAVPSQPPAAPPIPARLGEYQLLESLGGGGMGVVYRARLRQAGPCCRDQDALADPLGAGLKLVRTGDACDRPARAPNIVHAHDARQIDGIPFSSWSTTRSHACQAVPRGGALGTADACEIARQTAEGLQYIGDQGGSPRHQTLQSDDYLHGIVKILDLGLARFLMPDSQDEEMTAAGGVVGTASYIARSRFPTATGRLRADIYSLGRTLDRLLAGYASPASRIRSSKKTSGEGRQPTGSCARDG